jgi:hypothetical protein
MWFSVMAIYECKVENTPDALPLSDRSIFLINVEKGTSPERKAYKIGKQRETSYKNSEGSDVEWHLAEIVEIQDLCEETLYDGVEVFSHLDVNFHEEIGVTENNDERPHEEEESINVSSEKQIKK